MVMVHLDARRPRVRVPPTLRGDSQLRLNLSYRFASHDLSVGDDIVGCTLRFNGQPYYCELPVESIFAITSHVTGEALVWPESLAAALEGQLPAPAPPAPSPLAGAPARTIEVGGSGFCAEAARCRRASPSAAREVGIGPGRSCTGSATLCPPTRRGG